MSYSIPNNTVKAEYEVKKSRFITYAFGISDRADGMQKLADIKQEYPDARHHCWAYMLGNPNCPVNVAMSDDGEPSGTAGKPILNVLQHKDVGDIMIVVVRYFGGIKLGAGGLVRAYSSAAQQAIEQLEVNEYVALTHVTLTMDFKHEQFYRMWIEQKRGQVMHCEYANRVAMSASIPNDAIESLEAQCAAQGILCQWAG